MATHNIHNDMAEAKEREALTRVPQTGPYNEVSIPVVSAGAFATVGYFLGKWIGRLGDDNRQPNQTGRFEGWMKWVGAASMGLLAAAVSIRQTREAKEQAVALAKRSMELEQHNAALASVVTKPVGTLIETFDKVPEAGIPQAQVSETLADGKIAAEAQRAME